jgi:hypothetical protein
VKGVIFLGHTVDSLDDVNIIYISLDFYHIYIKTETMGKSKKEGKKRNLESEESVYSITRTKEATKELLPAEGVMDMVISVLTIKDND